MNAARLASLPVFGVGFDTETHKIQPGLLAPPLVCGSWATARDGALAGYITNAADTLEGFRAALADDRVILVGANIPYDMLVMATHAERHGIDLMPEIFQAYDADRVYDVQIAESLNAIALGTVGRDPRTGEGLRDAFNKPTDHYSLANCVKINLGRVDAKNRDRFRTSYALLEHLPIAEWPEDARTYPVDDARNTLAVALAQTGHAPRVMNHDWNGGETCRRCGVVVSFGKMPDCSGTSANVNLHTLAAECRASWALHLGAAWGLRTDPVATETLIAAAEAGRISGRPEFQRLGFVREDGTKDTGKIKRAVALAFGASKMCPTCAGTGKIYNKFSKVDPTKPVGSPINCKPCNGSGLELAGAPIPRTEGDQIAAGRDQLNESGDDTLMNFAQYMESDKVIDTYGPWLRSGAEAAITLKPNNPLKTKRVSYSGPVQLLPRQLSAHLRAELKRLQKDVDGYRVRGVRDCIKARDGMVYYSVDYTGGELVTHAESCFRLVGFSRMGEALNAGADVHGALGATIMGAKYDDFAARLKAGDKTCKDYRQAAKPANFGLPGGMGVARFVHQAREQGPDTPWPDGPSDLGGGVRGYKGTRFCLMISGRTRCGETKVIEWQGRGIKPTCRECLACGAEIKRAWFRQWPENDPYLKKIIPDLVDQGYIVQHGDGSIRGDIDYNSAANGFFQALLALIAKVALYRVAKEQYADSSSVLYGQSRPTLFSHDELGGEAAIAVAPECAERVHDVMVETFREYCPTHAAACKAEPTLMQRMDKAAACVRDENGRLRVWRPT